MGIIGDLPRADNAAWFAGIFSLLIVDHELSFVLMFVASQVIIKNHVTVAGDLTGVVGAGYAFLNLMDCPVSLVERRE